MKKIVKFNLAFLSLIFLYSCEEYINIKNNLLVAKKNLSDTKDESKSNINNLNQNNPVGVDIKILNPTNRSESNWYKKDEKTDIEQLFF